MIAMAEGHLARIWYGRLIVGEEYIIKNGRIIKASGALFPETTIQRLRVMFTKYSNVLQVNEENPTLLTAKKAYTYTSINWIKLHPRDAEHFDVIGRVDHVGDLQTKWSERKKRYFDKRNFTITDLNASIDVTLWGADAHAFGRHRIDKHIVVLETVKPNVYKGGFHIFSFAFYLYHVYLPFFICFYRSIFNFTEKYIAGFISLSLP